MVNIQYYISFKATTSQAMICFYFLFESFDVWIYKNSSFLVLHSFVYKCGTCKG